MFIKAAMLLTWVKPVFENSVTYEEAWIFEMNIKYYEYYP